VTVTTHFTSTNN